MMKNYILLLAIILMASCKKEIRKPVSTPKAIIALREPKSVAIDSAVIIKQKDSVLLAFYRSHGFGTIWNTPRERRAVIALLGSSVKDGLFPKDYHLKKLQLWEKKSGRFSNTQFIQYDILLTISLRRYLRHLCGGKLYPASIYRDWDLKYNSVDVNAILDKAIKGDSINQTAESCKPHHLVYKGLVKALAYIDDFPKDTIGQIVFKDKIYRNDTSAMLPRIKRRLMYWKEMKYSGSLSYVYDRETEKAIRKFQQRHGLPVDGVLGKGTINALSFNKEQRRGQIIANLERWRWFPRNMGDHYIIVNIPGYYLRIIKDGDTIERKRVVVGKAERKTPVLTSTFNNIVFNPTWTVPPTIVREDLTPDATKDRGYFAARNITIYDYKGRVVTPEKWNPEKAKGYRYVQSPGDQNSLGNVKFNFPNHYSVYLHDTNHRNFFVRNYRSLSSGCVRVEDPLPLAEYMLNDSIHWPMDSINKMVASKKTTTILLRQKIRLYQLYWTAWMERGNSLQFRDDIYNLDADLYQRLRK